MTDKASSDVCVRSHLFFKSYVKEPKQGKAGGDVVAVEMEIPIAR